MYKNINEGLKINDEKQQKEYEVRENMTTKEKKK
jgi:hypothetical protein